MDNYEEIVANLKKRGELLKAKKLALDSELLNGRIARWRSEAGVVADAMLESPSRALEEAVSCTGAQTIAIDILANYWKISGSTEVLDMLQSVIDMLQSVIRTTSDETVRAVAIFAVSTGLKETRNQFWLRFLAETVLKESEPNFVRRSAYFGLFLIVGTSVPIEPDASAHLQFNELFPQNVN